MAPLKIPCYRRTTESKCDRAPKSCAWDEDDEKCRSTRYLSCSRSSSRSCKALSSRIKKLLLKHELRVTSRAVEYLREQVCEVYKKDKFCAVKAKMETFAAAWKAAFPGVSKVTTDAANTVWPTLA